MHNRESTLKGKERSATAGVSDPFPKSVQLTTPLTHSHTGFDNSIKHCLTLTLHSLAAAYTHKHYYAMHLWHRLDGGW